MASYFRMLSCVLFLVSLCALASSAKKETCVTPKGAKIERGETHKENGLICECVGKQPDALCLPPDSNYQIAYEDEEDDDEEDDDGKKKKLPKEGTPEWEELKKVRTGRRKKIAQKYYNKKKEKMAAKQKKRLEKRRNKNAKLKAKRIRLRKEEQERMKKIKDKALKKNKQG